MINSQLVYSKELDFIPKLQLSKSRRAVYYNIKDYNKIPKKYLLDKKLQWGIPNDMVLYEQPLLKEGYIWCGGILRKGTYSSIGSPVIKNTKSVGKPRYFIINGQDLYSGKFERQQRADLILKLHQYFLELFGKSIYEKSHLWINSPLKIQITWFIKEDYKGPDLDNLWIVEKVLLDMMVKDLKVIPDDNHKIIKELTKKYEYRETEGFKIEIWKI